MKIRFGICTYNRKELVELTARSLKNIHGYEKIELCIYDDCSTDYDESFLREQYPTAHKIVVREDNVGADQNTAWMMQDYISSDADVLFIADSDLIFRKDVLSTIEHGVNKGYEFFSLFNANGHRKIADFNDEFIEKDYVGAAGVCLSRRICKIILDEVQDQKKAFDWVLCDVLKERGLKIICSQESQVQHIGLAGQNSSIKSFDYGRNFECDSLENAQQIENLFEKYIDLSVNNAEELNNRINAMENSLSWRITSPLRFLAKYFRK